MQFADFVASRALHLTSDCLRLLSGTASEEGALTASAAANLSRSVAHLESFWQLMQWSVGRADYRRARARLREAKAALQPDTGWLDAVASKLVAKAGDEKSRRAVKRARRAIAESARAGKVVDTTLLSRLFQEESAVWRAQASDRRASDADLVEYGIGRAFNKSRRAARRLADKPGSTKRLRVAQRWVSHIAHHLELLQPGLSKANDAKAWFIGRLDTNLTSRMDLARFAAAVQALPIKKQQRKRIRRLIQRLDARLIEQSGKLVKGAYGGGGRKALRAIAADVDRLGLNEIVVLPVAGFAEAGD